MSITIRNFTSEDIPQLLELKKALADIEQYRSSFRVTGKDIEERGLGCVPQFFVKVAVANEILVGMAVYYVIPYSYDLKPIVVIKELYVVPAERGTGVGSALFAAIADYAKSIKASSLTWLVMKGNIAAEVFYRRVGGIEDPKWNRWFMTEEVYQQLTED